MASGHMATTQQSHLTKAFSRVRQRVATDRGVMAPGKTKLSSIEYLRIFAVEEGSSRFETGAIDLQEKNYAPPAPSLNASVPEPSDNSLFLELPAGWYGDLHPTPVRQWLILMSGRCEFEAGDGEKAIRKAGDVVMLDDLTGKGQQTRVLGDEPVRIAAIHFS